MLLGTLPHSGRVRGVLSERMDHAHLDQSDRRGDAPARRDGSHMADRSSGDGDHPRHPRRPGDLRPGRQALRSGSRAVPSASGQPQGGGRVLGAVRLWTLVADDVSDKTPEDAQRSLDRVLRRRPAKSRERRRADGSRTTVAELGDLEPLLGLPAPFRRRSRSNAIVADNAVVAYRGNSYSAPPGLSKTILSVRQRIGSQTIEVVAPSGAVLVTHRVAPDGSGALVRITRSP